MLDTLMLGDTPVFENQYTHNGSSSTHSDFVPSICTSFEYSKMAVHSVWVALSFGWKMSWQNARWKTIGKKAHTAENDRYESKNKIHYAR